jgi:uncharacterized coiled-coil protein SlyX
MNQLTQFKNITILPLGISLTLACFALSPTAQALLDPPPDGGYPRENTAEGVNALAGLTTGAANTAIGFAALFGNSTGNQNTAIGVSALHSNGTGSFNTAAGVNALNINTTGSYNTATGWEALVFNNASFNTANGVQALHSNKSGSSNTAEGFDALYTNTTGSFNTATGANALQYNTSGSSNAASGSFALFSNTTGSSNTAVGFDALFNNTKGSENIALGLGAGGALTTGSNNIDIGAAGVAGESNKIRIGKVGSHNAAFVAGISGSAISGTAVVVNGNGRLGVASSSKRFKDQIKPMDNASEAILALKPVTFRYKPDIDPEGTSQFGLVAEDVEKVNPALVTRDDQGKLYTVRYEAVNAMLLNEFLKQHRKVEEHHYRVQEHHRKAQEQDATIAQLESTVAKQGAIIAKQQKQIEALTTGLQKVSDQLELSKPAQQMVSSGQ